MEPEGCGFVFRTVASSPVSYVCATQAPNRLSTQFRHARAARMMLTCVIQIQFSRRDIFQEACRLRASAIELLELHRTERTQARHHVKHVYHSSTPDRCDYVPMLQKFAPSKAMTTSRSHLSHVRRGPETRVGQDQTDRQALLIKGFQGESEAALRVQKHTRAEFETHHQAQTPWSTPSMRASSGFISRASEFRV